MIDVWLLNHRAHRVVRIVTDKFERRMPLPEFAQIVARTNSPVEQPERARMSQPRSKRVIARASIAIEAVTRARIHIALGAIVARERGANGLALWRRDAGVIGAPMQHDRTLDR